MNEDYLDLFKSDLECRGDFYKEHFTTLSASQLDSLSGDFRDEEMVAALKEMSPSKAHGLDGFNAQFYQRTWSITGREVISFVKNLQQTYGMPPGIAEALLVLIPKVECPSKIREYRPISLCNVIYKLITEVIANMLKDVWSVLISSNQASFVPRRQSIDNVLVCK